MLGRSPYEERPFAQVRRLWSDRTLRILTRELIWARIDAGLTRAQVARALGTQKSAISRLENGHTRPTLATIENRAQVVGCAVEVRLRSRAAGRRSRSA